MSEMVETFRKAQEATADHNTSKVPPTPTVQGSQDEGPKIQLSSAPTFGFDG